jgi:hypothetical protein
VSNLTGAFAGTGGFTISPIHGKPTMASKQFQAGLSVSGQGAPHNVTLFVMTSRVSNTPNIGFTQAGAFNAVTMRDIATWQRRTGGGVPTETAMPRTTMSNNYPARFLNGYAGRAMIVAVPSTTSFATATKPPLIGNGGGGTAASAGSFFQGGPSKMSPLHSVIGGPLILNGTGGYLGSGMFTPRKP